MNCERCGARMVFGAPHCETIKVQQECSSCGHIECEYYTPEEQRVNEMTAGTNLSVKEAWAALVQADWDLDKAKLIADRRIEI